MLTREFFFWGAAPVPGRKIDNSPVLIICSLIRYVLWSFKLRKKLPSWPSFQSEFFYHFNAMLARQKNLKDQYNLATFLNPTEKNKLKKSLKLLYFCCLISSLCRIVMALGGAKAETETDEELMDVGNDGEGGDNGIGDQVDEEALLREAEKLLQSPSSLKDKVEQKLIANPVTRPGSVLSLVGSLIINPERGTGIGNTDSGPENGTGTRTDTGTESSSGCNNDKGNDAFKGKIIHQQVATKPNGSKEPPHIQSVSDSKDTGTGTGPDFFKKKTELVHEYRQCKSKLEACVCIGLW
jgi:hypothetical protein